MNEVQNKVVEFFDNSTTEIERGQWYQWVHPGKTKTHCCPCLALDGCWFYGDRTPSIPLHPICECFVKPISPNWDFEQMNEFQKLYALGVYRLGELDNDGQRIIVNKKIMLVKPNGHLENV